MLLTAAMSAFRAGADLRRVTPVCRLLTEPDQALRLYPRSHARTASFYLAVETWLGLARAE